MKKKKDTPFQIEKKRKGGCFLPCGKGEGTGIHGEETPAEEKKRVPVGKEKGHCTKGLRKREGCKARNEGERNVWRAGKRGGDEKLRRSPCMKRGGIK